MPKWEAKKLLQEIKEGISQKTNRPYRMELYSVDIDGIAIQLEPLDRTVSQILSKHYHKNLEVYVDLVEGTNDKNETYQYNKYYVMINELPFTLKTKERTAKAMLDKYYSTASA